MHDKNKLIDLVQRYQAAKSAGQLDNSSEATMRTWIDELLSVFCWDVHNTQQVLTEHTLGRSEKEKLRDIGSTNTRPDYTLVNGSVMVTFVVNKDGSIVDPEVIKAVDKDLDNEALRVVKGMPKWNPGKQRGKPVRVKYTVPVTFRLQ